jgi:hypothetical protein
MNSQDLRNLQEAYLGLYEEETNSMRLPGETKKQYEKSKKRNQKLLDAKERERVNRARNQNPLFIGKNGKITKTQREQVDIYDIILSHLLDEGYVETLEAAEALMVNMSEEWLQSIIQFVENQQLDEGYVDMFKSPPFGRGRLTTGDPSKHETIGNPATLSPALRALQRSDQLQITEPGSRRQKLQQRRSQQFQRVYQSARSNGGSSSAQGLGSSGSPSGTTGRYQVGGSPGYGLSGIRLADSYEYDVYDIVLSHLLDEGYAETPEAAEALMVNMSEEWLQSIMEVTGGSIHSDVP